MKKKAIISTNDESMVSGLIPKKIVNRRSTRKQTSSFRIPLRQRLTIQDFLAHQAEQLTYKLHTYLTGNIQLTITDNKAVMISVQRNRIQKEYRVRLHHLFLNAPELILQALAAFIARNERNASRILNEFIDQHQDIIRPARPREPSQGILRTQGQVYDLSIIFDELNQCNFNNRVKCRITWGRQVTVGQNRQSIKVGSYCLEQNLIRIHPGLDQDWVPLYYLQWIVYHEMLHAIHPVRFINGRRRFHTNEFAQDERNFKHYEQAIAWEKENIAALLRL